jgi:hypothetical protein
VFVSLDVLYGEVKVAHADAVSIGGGELARQGRNRESGKR